ncbi:hypothetical protein G6F36_014916 [Rhizopus arrhizus]|nr:hypothetical protein G6F36_014916 [Rhizopus arrhizus]
MQKQSEYKQEQDCFQLPRRQKRLPQHHHTSLRPVTFGFGTAKLQEQETRESVPKALELPTSLKHLETATSNDEEVKESTRNQHRM